MSKLNKRPIGGGYRPLSVKGFTLIELLAVIVILAVIAIIVTPMVMNTIKSARENSAKSSALNYINAVEEYVAAENAKDPDNTEFSSTEPYDVTTIPVSNVEVTGQKPTSGHVKIIKGVVTDFDLIMGNYKITRTGINGEVIVTEAGSTPVATTYTDSILNGADPVLDAGMIPVSIANDGTVTKADTATAWYNYTNKEWANAVVVSSDVRNTYQSATAGTKLDTSKILAYYVWIPRYSYKLFNVAGTSGTTASTIEITFENKTTTKSTGTTNGTKLTHPAFTFGTTELNGFWVGKFELTGDTTTPTVLPNVTSLRNQNVSSLFNTIAKFKSDTYGITSDSHMMMNKEWGAVAYLTQSIYGKNSEVRINNNSNFTTGCGASADNASENATCQIAYGSNAADYPQSTTGNISGIFDMSGGAWEYIMGTYNSTISSSGFSSLPDSKYYQSYTDLASSPLGDSLKETQGWYNDYAGFVDSNVPWFLRGGGYSSSQAGVFYFTSSGHKGSADTDSSSRVIIAPGA